MNEAHEMEHEVSGEQIAAIIDQLDPVSVCVLHHYAESGKATGFTLTREEVNAVKRALEKLNGTDELKRCAIGLLYLAQAFEAHDSPDAAKALYSLMSWPPIMEAIESLRQGGLDEALERSAAKVTGSAVVSTVRSLGKLDRLSPEFGTQVPALVTGDVTVVKIPKADIPKLQKMFPTQKGLSRIRRPDFDFLTAHREGAELVVRVRESEEACRLTIEDFARTLEVSPVPAVANSN